MRKTLIAGNWKMFKTTAEALSFAEAFKKLYKDAGAEAEAAICAPFTQLSALKGAFAGTGIKLGAQNVHFEEQGAFTGEVSPGMLVEIGVDYTIVAHSERREYFGETDETANKKLHKLFGHGISPILCVGEKLEHRDAGMEQEIVSGQLRKDLEGLGAGHAASLVIAYEPIWAIGTGRTATPEQVDSICAFIRRTACSIFGDEAGAQLRILYGGSVKPGNIAEILEIEDVDGALVGGASLVAEDFIKIVRP
ncbi:MAG: triose-phosphate isomerase [Clostridiales Family XIII bacterium]|jgi:triosephosphate isomerase|nr:triose-phosphate isomerase [Clostridiales Family XIII bacterium]